MITVGGLAEALGLPLGEADPSTPLRRIAPLSEAGPDDLAFVAQKRYLPALRDSRAGCVLLRAEWLADAPGTALVAADPYLCYARASALFATSGQPVPGVHTSAVVDESAQLGAGVSVGAHASIDAGAIIGDGVVIEAGVRIGAGARIGDGCYLFPNVVIYHGVQLGQRCVVHANTTLGSDGFGFARGPQGWEKIHQLGMLVIGDGVDIGAGVTIDRGALGDTRIADGVIIDNQVHIAHNCEIGARTAIAGCVGFAGSTVVGADCTFAGQVGVSGHLRICDNAHLTGQSRVTRSIEEPGSYSSGTPLDKSRNWGRNAVRFGQLHEMAERIKALETALHAQRPQGAAGESPQDNEE